jgi:processive 1,2-diacylglycerol beta-glucosyltransferase
MHGSIETSRARSAPLGRALCLTGSIGSGHTRAAEAVREALLRSHAADEARVVDCLAHAWLPFRKLYKDAYIGLIERAPGLVGWLYRTSDTTRGGGGRRVLQRAALARLRALIAAERPETILCTHFLAAEVVSQMVGRGEWRGTFGVVVTDLDAHAMWAVCPNADRWFVALDETREILVGKGVPREAIEVTGIPIAGAFAAPVAPAAELRARHGLPASGPVLLVSGGGVGVSLLDSTLESLLRLPIDGGIALVCGRNDAVRRRAEAIVAAHPDARMRCTVLGFTDRMHELMRIADLSIGKPGGLTSSEALACGLPMAVVNPVPGQEERNSDHLLEWGVAIRLNSPETMAWRIARLLDDPAQLAAMRARALSRSRLYAADAVVAGLERVAAGAGHGPLSDAPREASATERIRAVPAGRATTRPAPR